MWRFQINKPHRYKLTYYTFKLQHTRLRHKRIDYSNTITLHHITKTSFENSVALLMIGRLSPAEFTERFGTFSLFFQIASEHSTTRPKTAFKKIYFRLSKY